jgi:hypothetical protein
MYGTLVTMSPPVAALANQSAKVTVADWVVLSV